MSKKSAKKGQAMTEATSEQSAEQDIQGQDVDTENSFDEQSLTQGDEQGEGTTIADTDEQAHVAAHEAEQAEGEDNAEVTDAPVADATTEIEGNGDDQIAETPSTDTAIEAPATEGEVIEVATAATESNTDTAERKKQQREAHKAAVADNKRKAKEARDKEREQRQAEKAAKKPNYGPRYTAAAQEVGRLRKEFLSALDEKAALLGVERVGEAVPVKNDALISLDLEIQATKDKLEALQQQRRELKGKSPELDAVNTRIRDLVKLRETARREKKAAYLETMKNLAETTESQEGEPASE